MKRIGAMIKPTLTLTIIAAIIAALLAVTYDVTGVGRIVPGLNDEQKKSYATLILAQELEKVSVTLPEEDKMLVGVYSDPARSGGVLIQVKTIGYAGKSTPIELLVAFDKEGTVLGVVITSMNETPGVGTRIDKPDYLAQYEGINGSPESVDVITGATISSQALKNGVQHAMEIFTQIEQEVFA